MTITEALSNAAPAFLRRPLDRQPDQPAAKPADALLDQIAADLAEALPDPHQPRSFTDQLRDFGDGADRLMAAHRQNTDRLRLALAENAVLRARNADLEQHAAAISSYWERQYDAVNARLQRVSSLYHALVGRFDLSIAMQIETREAAKREAFAVVDDTELPRPAGVEVQERRPTAAEPPAEDDHPVLRRLREPATLPVNRI